MPEGGSSQRGVASISTCAVVGRCGRRMLEAGHGTWTGTDGRDNGTQSRILCLRGPKQPTVPPKPMDCNDHNKQTAAWVVLSQRLTACEVLRTESSIHPNWSTITARINAVSLDQERGRGENDRSSYFYFVHFPKPGSGCPDALSQTSGASPRKPTASASGNPTTKRASLPALTQVG
jgi:hypothetical protein